MTHIQFFNRLKSEKKRNLLNTLFGRNTIRRTDKCPTFNELPEDFQNTIKKYYEEVVLN